VGIGCPDRPLVRGVQGIVCPRDYLRSLLHSSKADWLLDLPELGYLLLGLRVQVLNAAQRFGLENTEHVLGLKKWQSV
jgi:hypothetical protein